MTNKFVLAATVLFLNMASLSAQVAPNNGGVMTPNTAPTTGAPPTGAAGGVLSGTYPNPGFATPPGTVNTVSVVTSNGVSATVANPTTTPALTFTLGAITPSSVAIGAGSAITSSGAGGSLGTNAFTSTAYAPLASPTFTGTVTMPDAGTWGSGGINGSIIGGTTTAAGSFAALKATTGAFGGATIGTNALAVTGTSAFSAAITGTQSIGATSTDGLVLANTTAAANGAQQISPRIRLDGQGWATATGGSSQDTSWKIENVPVQGTTNPTSNLIISASINGAAYGQLFALNSFTGGVTLSGGTITGVGTITANSSSAYALQNATSSATVPNINPVRTDLTSGLGGVVSKPALIVGSVSALTVNSSAAGGVQLNGYTTAGILQNDSSGNVTTNSTANAATIAASFAADHRLTVVIAGTTYYLPVSTVAW